MTIQREWLLVLLLRVCIKLAFSIKIPVLCTLRGFSARVVTVEGG